VLKLDGEKFKIVQHSTEHVKKWKFHMAQQHTVDKGE